MNWQCRNLKSQSASSSACRCNKLIDSCIAGLIGAVRHSEDFERCVESLLIGFEITVLGWTAFRGCVTIK